MKKEIVRESIHGEREGERKRENAVFKVVFFIKTNKNKRKRGREREQKTDDFNL